MHDEHPARRCSSRAAPCGTCTPAQDEHLLRGCSSWAGSFRTFLAAGRRSAVAAGEFSGLLPRPADQREATSPRKARGQRTPMSLSFHYHFISFPDVHIPRSQNCIAAPLAVPRRRMHAVPRHGKGGPRRRWTKTTRPSAETTRSSEMHFTRPRRFSRRRLRFSPKNGLRKSWEIHRGRALEILVCDAALL